MILRTLTYNSNMRKYLTLVVSYTLLGVLFYIYLHYSDTGKLPIFQDHGRGLFISAVLTNVIGLLILRADVILDRILSWRKFFLLRFVLGFILNTMIAISLVYLSSSFLNLTKEAQTKLSILFAVCIFLFEIFYGWFYSYRYYAQVQVQELQAERWQLELQFQSLKNQISPHYLFNCLNTISSLLYKDSHVAEKFIRRMAETFRYVLSNEKQKLVTLQREIDFVKAYYFLLQVRYEQHLLLEINLPKSIMSSAIPPLTLQLLIENAVKHNEISKEMPLKVYISAIDNTHILVTNNRTNQQKMQGFKIGIDNIRQRYKFFTKERVEIKEGNQYAVQLPVLKNTIDQSLV